MAAANAAARGQGVGELRQPTPPTDRIRWELDCSLPTRRLGGAQICQCVIFVFGINVVLPFAVNRQM